MIGLDALGPSGAYRSRTTERVDDVAGRHVADLSLVPSLFVQRAMRALRRAQPPPPERRRAILAAAGALFATGTVGGLTVDEYRHRVARVSGLPISAVRRTTEHLGDYAAQASDASGQARPTGAAADWRAAATPNGGGVWTRRGDVLAVHAPANTPAIHTAWLDAVALGYRVAVRPSRREPFTAHRLVLALREAGLGGDQAVLLPTGHSTAGAVISAADLAIAFGGDQVTRKYGGTAVLSQGPGRSKILIADGEDPARHLDLIVESVADQAGTGCVNATAVFVEGDPLPLAEALADRLGRLRPLPPEHAEATLPVKSLGEARAVDDYLRSAAGGAKGLLGGAGVSADLGDGSASLTPAVFVVEHAGAPQLRVELGFPCVWVAPWRRSDGIGPLSETLVLTAVTEDENLIRELVGEPGIANVYIGPIPTTWTRPGLPHDGYLGEFLMRSKSFARTGK